MTIPWVGTALSGRWAQRVLGAAALGLAGPVAALPVVTGGLRAAYEFTGNAVDLTGNGNALTVAGATLTADRFGNPASALLFDDVHDYARTDGPVLDIGGAYSLNWWFRIDTPDNGYPSQTLFNTDPHTGIGIAFNHASDPGPVMRYYLGTGQAGWDISGAGGTDGVSGANRAITVGQWHQQTLVHDAGTWRFYVDGVLDAAIGSALAFSLSPQFYFGQSSFRDTWLPAFRPEPFSGAMDDISLYARALSVAEIGALGAAPVAGVPEPDAAPLLALAGLAGLAWGGRRGRRR